MSVAAASLRGNMVYGLHTHTGAVLYAWVNLHWVCFATVLAEGYWSTFGGPLVLSFPCQKVLHGEKLAVNPHSFGSERGVG